jgi:hypothetical protein
MPHLLLLQVNQVAPPEASTGGFLHLLASVPLWLWVWVLALVAGFAWAVRYSERKAKDVEDAVEALAESFRKMGPLHDESRRLGRPLAEVDQWRVHCGTLAPPHRPLANEVERDLVILEDGTGGLRLMLRDGEDERLSRDALVERFANARLIEAVPGLLTAGGLIGTFLAIAYGLGSLTTNGPVIEGVNVLLEGLGGKFITSIVALGLAAAYQLYDAAQLSRRFASAHVRLQDALAAAFPRLAPQQQVATLVELARGQANALTNISSDLVGQFSDVFSQDLLPNLSQLLSTQLERDLGPMLEKVTGGIASMQAAIEKLESGRTESVAGEVKGLAENLERSMKSALEEIGRQFSTALTGAAGNEFTNATAALADSATVLQGMNSAFKEMQTSLQTLIAQAEQRANAAFEEGEGRTKALNDLVERLVSQLSESATSSAGEVQRLLVDAVAGLGAKVNEVAQELQAKAQESARLTAIANAEIVSSVTDAAGRTSSKTEEVLQLLGERSGDFVAAADQLQALREGVQQVLATTGQRLKELQDAASAFRSVATEAASMTSALRETQQKQQSATAEATSLVTGVATLVREQQATLERTKATFTSAQEILGGLDGRLAKALDVILTRMQDYNTAVEKNFNKIVASSNEKLPELFEHLSANLIQIKEVVEELADTMEMAKGGNR